MDISVKHDIDKLLPKLAAVGSRQVPFVVAKALTKTAQIAQTSIKDAMPNVFDRPTNYTLNSTYLKPATKSDLVALIKLKDQGSGLTANKWLYAEVAGGTRNLKRSEKSLQIKGYLKSDEQIVPGAGASLDGSGNMRGSQVKRILTSINGGTPSKASKKRSRSHKAEYFVPAADSKLPRGVYQRIGFSSGSAIKPVLIFAKKGSYRKRLPFHEIVNKVVERNFSDQLNVAIYYALQTAR